MCLGTPLYYTKEKKNTVFTVQHFFNSVPLKEQPLTIVCKSISIGQYCQTKTLIIIIQRLLSKIEQSKKRSIWSPLPKQKPMLLRHTLNSVLQPLRWKKKRTNKKNENFVIIFHTVRIWMWWYSSIDLLSLHLTCLKMS